jgi:hypothetical protein
MYSTNGDVGGSWGNSFSVSEPFRRLPPLPERRNM